MKTKLTLTALVAMAGFVGAAHAQTVFVFEGSGSTIGAGLSGELTGSFTVSGIEITATASEANFNATGSGFGINQAASGDDTDGFDFTNGTDNSEGFTLSFDQAVYLNSFSVSSFGSSDEVTITDSANSVATITSTGSTSLGNYLLGSGSTLNVSTTAGTYGNGWSFDSITVTAVPELRAYALIASLVCLTAVMTRRRRA